MDVDLRDVRAFCRVVDLGSVTDAAASLGETKGSLSRRVARLERALGTALLRRSGRRLEPTDEGLAYRDQAGAGLERLDQAADALLHLRDAPSGHLRVTAPIGLGTQLLAPLIGPFVVQYPQVTLEVILTDDVLSFREHRIDVAIRISRGLPDSALVAKRLGELQGELAAAPAYLAAHGVPTDPEELARHRTLTVPWRGPVRLTFARGDETRTVPLRGHVRSHDMRLLREAAIGGAGISMLPSAVLAQDVAEGRLVRVLPEWRLTDAGRLWLLHAPGPVAPKVRAFRDFVVDRASSVNPLG